MKISLDLAAEYLNTSVHSIYSNPQKFKKFVKNGKFDMDAWEKQQEQKQREEDKKYDSLNFADFLMEQLGEESFYKTFHSKHRQKLRDGIKNCKISLRIAELIDTTFSHYRDNYENYNNIIVTKAEPTHYVPVEKRKKLTKKFFMVEYWHGQKTMAIIAKELNVPESWVYAECKRVGATKGDNNIKPLSGNRKGYIMPTEEREKHENQPHAKKIVRISPKTFKVLEEYSSQGAVERYGFNRENVRKAIKRAGLHKAFLWAFKGMEKPTIKMAKKRGNLDTKLRMTKYRPPSKKVLEEHYIKRNKTLEECGAYFGCDKTTIAVLASKYELKKRFGKISVETLKEMYVEQGLSAKEIANVTGYSASSISTYLSRYGIRKGVLV